ncbi:unnamed protein product [Dibothriocephalus latus]|uniref:Iron-sulfur protein NUBPL n=1 Tax=Dibothriocephalus latus TaxID=60516 RepID=A0A3P6VE20_DIBLA|nr:unnamed protein product [Dibothriocephalus latus]
MWISRILRSSLLGVGTKSKNVGTSRPLPKKLPIAGVQNVVLIASAKGGVGKSTVAVNLALASNMLNSASRIGLMDADVFGPSIPQMMGLEGIEPEVNAKKLIIPLQNYGIKTMSMGSLIKKESAVVWRGLMVAWGPLDTLFVDTPPGTGDVQLSISQNIPVQGAVIVTTSHSLSLADTRRGIEMMLKLNVPLIGVVENMSHFVCPCCKTKTDLWQLDNTADSDSGATKLAAEYNIPLLCRLPIEPMMSVTNDRGQPVMISHPDSESAATYRRLAAAVHDFLAR